MDALARAHENVAEVLSQMGNLAPAVEHARRAVALLQTLTTTYPAESSHRRHLVSASSDLGDLLGSPIEFSLGQWGAAEVEYRRALAVAETLAAADPRDAQGQLTVASLNRKLGNVVARRDARSAVDLHRRAVGILDKLLATAPQNVAYRRQQALNHLWLGQSQQRLGQPAAALGSVGEALQIQQDILKNDPARQTVRQDVVASYNVRGDLQLDMGADRAALQSYTAALDVAEKVFAAARLDEWARRDRLDCYERMGNYWARHAVHPGLPVAAQVEAWNRAREWHDKSLAEWREWLRLHPNVYIERRYDQARRAVAACAAGLARVGSGAVTPS
jgi:tetratricopeptide (TPR) repeat protein